MERYAAIIDHNEKSLYSFKMQLIEKFPSYRIDCYNNENSFIENHKGYQLIFIDYKTCHFFILNHIQSYYPDSHVVFLNQNHSLLYKPYDDLSSFSLEVRYRGSHIYIETSNIYYIESYYHAVHIYDASKEYQGIDNTLQYYHNILNHDIFIKINQSTLVNLYHIKDSKDDCIILDNDQVLYPSSRYKSEVLKKIKKNIA